MIDHTDIGLAILHIATGLFFLITGARKVFLRATRQAVFGLLASHGVKYSARWMVVLGELFGGAALLFGFLTPLAAAGLVVIMAGAYVLDTMPGVWAKNPDGFSSWASASKLASNLLCTPEAQLLIICATLAFTGSGALSVDGLLF